MTTSSTNFTGLYGGGTATAIPNSAYGNANVVSLLATSTDGANTVGNISATGNVTGNYFIGNGSLLTGIASSTYGNANVTALLAAGITSNVITTANISGGYILGNGSQLTGLPATYGNANVATLLAGFGSNSISTTGNVAASYFSGDGSQLSNINAGNILGTYGNANVVSLLAGFGSNTISTTGNVTSGNLLTPGIVSATGNITGSYFLGNGSQLTGLPATYGNANVATFLANFGSNSISTTGNVTAGYVIGNGSLLTSLTGANVSGTVANATYALNANAATFAGTVTTAAQPNITSVGTLSSLAVTANVTGGNINTGGQVLATGNITGSYFLGNGSQLTGLPATYGNANVATFLANFGSNSIVTTGNITGGNFIGSGAALSSITGGNVTGTVANATFATSAGTATSATTAGTVTDAAQPNITSVGILSSVSVTGNIVGGNVNTAGQVSATGNVIGGNLITGGALIAPSFSAIGNVTGGNLVTTGNVIGVNADFGGNITIAGGIVATGSNLQIGNIVGGNIELQSQIRADGNITGGNIISNAAVIAGSVSATTIGNAGASLVGATVSTTGNITGSYFFGNGSTLTGVTASPAGANTYVQYNNAGALGASAKFNYSSTYNLLNSGNIQLGDPSLADTYSVINSYQAWSQANSPNLGRVIVGPGYAGNYTNTYDPLSVTRGSQLAVIGKYSAANTDTNQSMRTLTSTNYFDLGGGTLNNANRRLNAGAFVMNIANGTATLTTGQSLISYAGSATATTVGNLGGLGLGNANVSHAVGHFASVNVFAGGNVGNGIAFLANPAVNAATGNIYNYVGYGVQLGGTAGQPTPLRAYGVYNPDNIGSFGFANGNTVRAATNYYFLYNEDNVARNRMGSLETYTEYAQQAGTTGSVSIDKNAGQVQQLNLTGNATLSYSNFVTSASDSVNTDYQADTVTLIINQGATGGYGVTFPTPSSVYKYAGNITALQTTSANSVSMVSITAVFMNSQTTYLTTISPGFV